MDNAECQCRKAEYAGYAEGAQYPEEKKSVAGQFAAVKHRSETYCWTQKLNREDDGVDKYWVLEITIFSCLRFSEDTNSEKYWPYVSASRRQCSCELRCQSEYASGV